MLFIYVFLFMYTCYLCISFLIGESYISVLYLWNKHIASLNQNILFVQFVVAFINVCLCLTPLLT